VATDAKNGNGRSGAFFGSWFAIWIVVRIIFYALLRVGKGSAVYGIERDDRSQLAVSATELARMGKQSLAGHRHRRRHETILLLNVWGIVWRANKEDPALDGGNGRQRSRNAAGSHVARPPICSDLPLQLLSDVLHHHYFMAAASHFPLLGA
jgi:hypothetical protein